MPGAPDRTFALQDTTVSLPERPFEFSRSAWEEGARLASARPDELFTRLLHEQESETTLLVARRIIAAFLSGADAPEARAGAPPEDADAEAVAAHVSRARDALASTIASLGRLEPEVREAVARQRAPIGLLGGCWLDVVSQPATQPSVVVNRLFAHHWLQRGEGNRHRAVHQLRHAALERLGADLPDVMAADFLPRAGARPLTALHACFYLALSRLPASFLPEVVGTHYAFHALGVDDLLLGIPPALSEAQVREALTEFLALAGPSERRRLHAAIRLTLMLEREHVAALAELGSWRSGLSLESKVAEIVARHGPLAGRQHGAVRVGGRLLSETFSDPDLDLAAFLTAFRESPKLRPLRDGTCLFLRAIKFGGPMFGIFDDREASVLRAWVASVQAGERPPVEISPNTVGDAQARRWLAAIAASEPADVVVAEAAPRDDRELFHRLVNIESFPNTLALAADRAARCFEESEVLFTHGAAGRYTDASWFDYSPKALYERAERVYWDKLVDPYRPLEVVPDRDEVVFRQTTYHLTYLIDGAWIHRTANLGRTDRESDAMLFAIYADEMGHGDLRKNHLMLANRAIDSMGIELPHIRDEAFMEQVELPDQPYGFAIQQLCMCLFPDRFYNEILGYNLAVEMYGAGEVRLHEIQKLRHHGFDISYEQAHLTIDNFSAGHTKQAADIIVSYLDGIGRALGDAVVQEEWRRIWRGYASFAYFLEAPLLKSVAAEAEMDDLVI
ncbi:MAG TPA: iron-containing redox enzyme family protein [Candidatus Eisenbacteria bacterium]|nr:iron-containing redox enzyme family protein [Candidatus Eisenbacteria bacterium]